jgi:hypothetical protein
MISSQDRDELQHLEESLWIAHTRFDQAYMEQLLSLEFVEFGHSGKVYGRAETLSADCIEANVFLATYVSESFSEGEVLRANRSSLWIKTPQGWQLRFHQGTPVRE